MARDEDRPVGKDADPGVPDHHEELAGMSDEAVAAATGRTWPDWVRMLDAAGAAGMPHPEVARHLRREHGLGGWWAQTVTVGYERLRGLRAVGQRRDGSYDANKSRTLPVPLATLWRAFADEELRESWLPGVEMEIRTRNEEKNVRATLPDGTRVALRFESRGVERSTLTIQHRRLPDRRAREERRELWAARLDALEELLKGRG